MRPNDYNATRLLALRAACILSFAAVAAFGQVSLTASRTNLTLPDGTLVPMWGYSCPATATGSTAKCAALNPSAPAVAPFVTPPTQGWSPVVITVQSGQDLTVTLTNNLPVPTSLVIVGQLGGGLGSSATSDSSPDHTNAQPVTWPIPGPPTGTPPGQGPRVRSFSTEVASNGGVANLTWKAPRPGTYLIESGTHPSIQGPMGLYGILVVTTAPSGTTAGTAYPAPATTPAVTYNAEIPLLFSEIDPVQNVAVNTAVSTTGFTETTVWTGGPDGCGAHFTCYPPAVNYTPLYYTINGVAFDKTNAAASVFPTTPATGVTGTVLVRLVNAGLRMHVPSIVGSQTGTAIAPATVPPSGFSLIAEDGNPLPGVPRVQSEVFLAAGKTYDVMINAPAAGAPALPIFDRQLSLSGNGATRDAGMLAYIGANGGGAPLAAAIAAGVARADGYPARVANTTITVSDPNKGVIANDTNVNGVTILTLPASGTVTLNRDGTFTYVADATIGTDSFTYCANGTVTAGVCSSGLTATVTLGAETAEAASGITVNPDAYSSNVATTLSIKSPGVLSNDKDAAGYRLIVAPGSVVATSPLSVTVDPSGAFVASVPAGTASATFTYKAQNSQGTVSANAATVTLTFASPSHLAVTVKDGANKTTTITDYRWIIEEDRTFYVDPTKTTNTCAVGANCPIVPTFGTNFHTSYMPVVATGCTGTLSCEDGQTLLGQPAVCDGGNGVCRTTSTQQTPVDPGSVHLDPTKRYYISVLPGDAANPFIAANASNSCVAGGSGPSCGHGMGGAPIAAGQTAVTIFTQPTPLPSAKLTVFVFQDDFPLNGEQDGGGGIDVLSPNEQGLGGFNITLFDDAGGTGDSTGQMTYDMFNQPLGNSLDGTKDPATGQNACPISAQKKGITGTIVTCPKYEGDGKTLSPLAGQAVIANMMPGRYGVVATPAADRIARGEEWLQTNTLDGQKAHDSFLKVGEPSFFQEFGPAGYHVSIGFANPKIINSRKAGVCNATDPNISGTNCTNTVTGKVTTERMSRTPDERLYSSGSNDSFGFTQCYVSFGDADGEDFAFTKCNPDGTFTLSGLPDGTWRVTVFDQWNDMLVDGLSTPVGLGTAGGAASADAKCPGPTSSASVCDLGDVATNQWQANIYTSTFFDQNGNGVRDNNEPGLSLVPTNIRFRDGSFSNFNSTDLQGNAGFNEVFPLFSWYVVETDSTRYKNTGTHVVYDAGGPADGTPGGGTSNIGNFMANTKEIVSLPTALHVPGARYCASADCPTGDSAGGSTGRVDPPWVTSYGWQGFSGQNSFLEFGKKPFAPNENGGIHGHVVYASTRPFDDPSLLLQLSWEPLVPHVTINLYQEGTATDGVTQTLTLVDTTQTSSFDDWAQGFRSDGVPNMNCPGQGRDTGTAADIFFFTLYNQPMYLDVYNNPTATPHALPSNSQFKCYDGMHNWNQLQPAPYDGMYQFPSIIGRNPTTGVPVTPPGTLPAVNGTPGSVAGTNCTICVANPTDPTTPMLPVGKYVVEVVVPPGYELVKEEDKNILIGDNYIAPAVPQFPGLGSAIYILPDQAAVAATYNANNAQNSTTDLGHAHLPQGEGDTGSIEQYWPCVGQQRIVPDFISLFPGSGEVAPFAGATRPLCDRKEVTLQNEMSALAKFYVFTSTHAAAHFTGVITDDFTSEFDPFSPQFGEKFSPANLPVSIQDWSGTEISRVYTDQWGSYNGLTYSTWEVNPPNPTGYAPTMMVTCMNDPGRGNTPDPLYNPAYSNFCYEIPFMPGQTQYMDTPVTPTSAFAGAGYNNPDCNYPGGTSTNPGTPAISQVNGDGLGPWVSAAGKTLTINALGDQIVTNNAYSGPTATVAPYNAKTITRHYGFGDTQGTGSVTIGGVAATVTGWSDAQITVTVPANVPACAIQQQAHYGGPGPNAPSANLTRCGELLITTGNGKQSIDTVTVTVGGKTPIHVPPTGSIQAAIDAASPGDMLIIDPNCTTAAGLATACTASGAIASVTHNELLLMWKPVRLQGVGAASSIINANTHPAGKIDAWRRKVDCLFGFALNGTPISRTNPFDPTSGGATCPSTMQFQVDRLPLEATVGWDATLSGNLAELLQEPTLMGALEGAAITVLSKGVSFPRGSNPYAADTFPVGTRLLTNNNSSCGNSNSSSSTNPFPSNFQCNPSSIDGLGITNSSQGGGGIFVHAWGHNLEIANNRIYNNAGTLSGGINVGQGEFPPPYLGGAAAVNADPGSCQSSNVANLQLPYCHNLNVNVHNNAVKLNSSTGDELFSATPAGAGGVSFCTGADSYKFNYNWVCGNLSTGDGGGLAHIGFSYNGTIEHNTFLFNQSANPTIATNGGGILVMGAPDVDPACADITDADCVPQNPNAPSDGTGPGLVINANLIMGNAAESGSGGGIRLQNVNGTDISTFPNDPSRWNDVKITNNIIANNVAGWDGAGISLQDALKVDIINNTVMSNDTTASSGVLFNTLGAPLASSGGPTCTVGCGTSSAPQPAGLAVMPNTAQLLSVLPASIACPTATASTTPHPNCRSISNPYLANDVFFQNRSFYIGVGTLGPGVLSQQNVVALYNAFTTNPAASQPKADATTANGAGLVITGGTGACDPSASYWDIGVRGDTGPTNHGSSFTLAPTYSVLTSLGGANDYAAAGLHNTSGNPTVLSQYCNGSRVPPELGSAGYQVPPGISDATVPNPVFSLTPAATVDEGNNWINISWGPLSLTQPLTGLVLGNYSPASTSSVINLTPSNAGTAYAFAPPSDFFNTARKTNNFVDAGAVEFTGGVVTGALTAAVSPSPLAFGSVPIGTNITQNLTVVNTGTGALAGGTFTFGGGAPQPFTRVNTGAFPAGAPNCTGALAVGASCTIKVQFAPTTAVAFSRTLTVTYTGATVTGSPVTLTGSGSPQGTLTFTSATNGTLTTGLLGVRTLTFTIPAPRAAVTSVVTITNSGAGPLQITAENLIQIGGLYTLTGTTCSFTTPLAPTGTCTVNVSYATPATLPANADTGLMTVANNGSGTLFGVSGLTLSAR